MARQGLGPAHEPEPESIPGRVEELYWDAVSAIIRFHGVCCFVSFKIDKSICSVAWAQMYLTLATLFRPNKNYRLKLGETDESDVFPVVDNEFGVAKYDSRGLNVVVV